MTADHARLRALAQAATPGPWEDRRNLGWAFPETQVVATDIDRKVAVLRNGQLDVSCTIGKAEREWANAAYIGAANPKAVLALLDQLVTATQHQDDLRSQLQRAQAQAKGLREERDAAILTRNAALVRAVTAEQRLAADPDDQLDDVLPLRQLLPLNLPASLDLCESEGGHHD